MPIFRGNGITPFAASAGTASSALTAGTANSVVESGLGMISSWAQEAGYSWQTRRFDMTNSDAVQLQLPNPISFSFIRVPVSFSAATVNMTVTTSDFTASMGTTWTTNAAFYSLGTGANSASLQYVTSSSCSLMNQLSLTFSSSGGNASWTWTSSIVIPYQGAYTTYTTSQSSSSSTINFSAQGTISSLMIGPRFLDIPFAASLSHGPHWLVFGATSTTTGDANTTQLSGATGNFLRYTQHYGNIQSIIGVGGAFNPIGMSSNQTSGFGVGGGASYVSGAGGTTSSIPVTQLAQLTIRPYIQLLRSA